MTSLIEWDFTTDRPVADTICWRCGSDLHTSELVDINAPDGPMCAKCAEDCKEAAV